MNNLEIQIQQANRRGKNRKARKQPEPTALAREYQRLINEVIAEYEKATNEVLLPVIEYAINQNKLELGRFDSWVDDIDSALNTVISLTIDRTRYIDAAMLSMASKLGEFNQSQFKKITDATLGVNVALNEPWLDDELKAWSKQNVRLVKSVPDQEHTQISRIALEGVRSGKPVREIQAEIAERHKISKGRAKTIARTETGKLNGELTKRRQQEIGIETYFWRTSRDDAVRVSHQVMNGLLCRWDDDTVYSDDGGATWNKRSSIGGYIGRPGEDFNCRCGAESNTQELLSKLGV